MILEVDITYQFSDVQIAFRRGKTYFYFESNSLFLLHFCVVKVKKKNNYIKKNSNFYPNIAVVI